MPAPTHGTSEQKKSIYSRLGVWQMWGQASRSVVLAVNHQSLLLQVTRISANDWQVTYDADGAAITLSVENLTMLESGTAIRVNGHAFHATGISRSGSVFCRIGSLEARFKKSVAEHAETVIKGDRQLIAPMPGRIIAVNCQDGDTVSKGDVLMTLEAMKMEHSLVAIADTRVDTVLVSVNDQVEQGMQLALFNTGTI